MDHQHPQNSSQVWISAEFLRCAETDQDWKEDICRVGESVDHRCKTFDGRISFNQRFSGNKQIRCREYVVQSHHQTTSYDGRDDWYEDIRKQFDALLDRIQFLRAGCFDFFFAHGVDSGHFDEFFVDFIDDPGSQDDLVLTSR